MILQLKIYFTYIINFIFRNFKKKIKWKKNLLF